MNILRMLAAFLLAFAMTAASAQNFVPVPPLKTRVTDLAGMLTPAQRATLEGVLKDYEDRTGSQIAILLVPKTEPEAIEQYSIRVYDQWQLGRKGVDDGVLLLVAKDNPASLRRFRIEAGRGVQGSLTDAQSKRILQDVIAPHFRQNDFYGGLTAGVSAITTLLDKEQFPTPQKRTSEADEDVGSFPVLLFFAVLVLFMLLSRGGRRRGRYGRYGRHGNAWGYPAGLMLGRGLGGWGRSQRPGGFDGFGGGFGGGGFGGFSGGGGSADGGGASGNW